MLSEKQRRLLGRLFGRYLRDTWEIIERLFGRLFERLFGRLLRGYLGDYLKSSGDYLKGYLGARCGGFDRFFGGCQGGDGAGPLRSESGAGPEQKSEIF